MDHDVHPTGFIRRCLNTLFRRRNLTGGEEFHRGVPSNGGTIHAAFTPRKTKGDGHFMTALMALDPNGRSRQAFHLWILKVSKKSLCVDYISRMGNET
ncbi:hypothetical protein ACFL9U_10660 [Thermodesulfobacteriota bacterium]